MTAQLFNLGGMLILTVDSAFFWTADSPETKALDAMKLNGRISDGNYFNMPAGDTPYRIALSSNRPTDSSSLTTDDRD